MNKRLSELLRSLEDELNPDLQNKIEERHQRALNWEQVDKLPLVITYPFPAENNIKPFPHREIFDDPEKMLFNELVHAFDSSILMHKNIGDDLPYTIRTNFGTVVIASVFGAKIEQRNDNPPWVRHYETLDKFQSIFDCDPLDFSKGISKQVIERYQFYNDVLADFPNLIKCVKIVLPDLQGPLDTLELLRGSSIYEDFIIDPEMVEKGLRLVAEAQVGLAKHLQLYITDGMNGFTHQHAVCVKGNILIRNDSAIMISPEMYAGQVAHHDEFVLKELGGGAIHSCGKIDFNVPEIVKLPSLKSFDFGQSYMNDIDSVYELAREVKTPLLRIRPSKEELISGEIQKRYPTGVSLVYDAATFDEARKVSEIYFESCK
ncbi:hypothetical protein [Maribellus sediminis]|uniref:hypothetical protein n=1 Tax=Maribellus sediminis TaxID=2696285 RepID=UPI001431ECA8|nr:hypothetical protein [Maribellus sediminis]